MIVTCEHCSARYKLDDEKIKGKGARITCPRCKHVFVVLAKQEETPAESAAPAPEPARGSVPEPTPQPAAPAEAKGASAEIGGGRRADQLDFRKVGIATWKVRVKIGLVYDFSDTGTLRKYIQDRRVTEDDVISHDGTNWVRIGDIPDLDTYFVQVYEELAAQRGDEEEDSEEEGFGEGPTMVVGMGSLRSNISTGVFARPQPRQEAAASAPRPTPQPAEPAPPGQRFADPFESLKARQRERMRANRRGAATQGRRTNGQDAGTGAAPNRRNLYLAAAALVAVVGVGYYYLRNRPAPKPSPVDVALAGPITPRAEDAEAVRKRLLDQLDRKLQPTGNQPPDPIEDPASEKETYEVVVPSDMAIQRGSAQPERHTPEPAVTAAKTTAADYVAAAQTSARTGDWAGAVRAYQDALALEPRNSDIKLELGVALYRKGDLDAASAQLAPLASSGNCQAKLWQARCLRDLGDVAGASGNYQGYIDCSHGDATAQRELQQLTGG